MNYPFLYQIIGTLNPEEIKKSIQYSGEKTTVWDDWQLLSIESKIVRDFLKSKFPHLKIFKNLIYISEGTTSNFHLDRFSIFHLLHRVLIPLNNNYKYEWVVDEKIISYEPKIGEVLLFNNMQPHRFVSNNTEKREAVYTDLYDPRVEKYLENFSDNYSHENSLLEKRYP